MSDLFSPIGRSLPGTTGATGPVVVAGVIQDPPRNVAGLALGTILKGTVVGREPNGTISIATDKGVVRVATNAALPPGSHVTLEVRTAGDRLQVLILAVENAPVARQGQPSQPAESGQAPGNPPATSRAATTQATSGSGARAADAAALRGGAPAPAPASSAATPAQPQAEPPAIQVVGSSLTAIVVHQPAPGSLLAAPPPKPDFLPGPDPAPGDIDLPLTPLAMATLEARLKAQLTSLVEIEAALTKQDGETKAPAGPGALQPDATAKVASLFAETTVTGAKAGNPAPSGATLGLSPFAAAAVEAATQTPARTLAVGSEVTLKILAVLAAPGDQLQIAPEAAHATNPLIGRVQGYTPAGHPIVQTPLGMLMLHQKTSLPVGAQVALGIELTELPAPAAMPLIVTPQQAMLSLSRGWPTLADLFEVVMRSAGGLTPAETGIDLHLPQTGARLAAGLLNAIAALRSGDIDQLLGPLIGSKLLPAEKQDAVKRLRQEFAQLSQLAQDRPGVDWRALFLPIYDPQYGLTQINLFYRRGSQGQPEEAEDKAAGTRFIVEANFTLLGAFQLDGLVRKKRFDLMIRSRKRLSPRRQHEILEIFDGARDLGGYAGALQFQTVTDFPVSPLEDLRKSAAAVTA